MRRMATYSSALAAASRAAHTVATQHDARQRTSLSCVDPPGRCEPGLKQRRQDLYDWLTKPHREIKGEMAKDGR